jgi:PKD repeat protein
MNADGTNKLPLQAGYDEAWQPASSEASPLVAAFKYACSGLVCTFDASSSQGYITNYQWSFGDGTSAAGPVAIHTYATGATYAVSLTLFTGSGDKAVTAQPVTPNSPPTSSFTFACVRLTCSFDGSSSQGTLTSYAWSFGDGTSGAGSPVTHSYGAGGTYTVTLTVTDYLGATASTTHSLVVLSASFIYQCTGSTCTFDGSSSQGPVTSYAWTFGDGTQSAGATVTHTYSTGGTYSVTLSVAGNSGATASTSKDVIVRPRATR